MTQPVNPAAGPRPRRWHHPALLALVATVALVGSVWSVWNPIREELAAWARANKPPAGGGAAALLASNLPPGYQRDQDPNGSLDRPIRFDETANWTEVALYRPGLDRPRPVIVVRRATQAIVSNDGVARGLVTRELVRQSLILAAREGFDVLVRDLAIGDPDEVGTADATYRLGSFLMAGKHASIAVPQGARITITEGQGSDRKVLLNRKLDVVGWEMPDHAKLVGQLKLMIDKDFRDLLAGWKLPPSTTPQPAVEPDKLPDGVEPRLLTLAETEQFAAIRALHDAIHRQGGSPTRWLALARGYALLGSLTESLFGATHAVFKARSLLYAQVGVDAAKGTPASLRDQAFAEALAGIFAAARADLDAADKSDASKGATPRTEMLRAFLATDPDALLAVADRLKTDHTALYLAAVVRSRLSGRIKNEDRINRHEILDAADRVLTQVPDVHRVINLMCDASGVVNLHRSTILDLEPFATTSAQRVHDLPGLPPAVTSQFEAGGVPDEVALRQALDKAAMTDSNDLSWGAMAQILREIRFLQVCQRLYFLAFSLSSGSSEFVEEARLMLKDHPNRDFVDLYSGQFDENQAAQIMRRLDFADLENKNLGMLYVIYRLDRGFQNQLYHRSMSQSDWGLVPNWERAIRNETEVSGRKNWARALLNAEPTSPVARSALVEADWDNTTSRVAGWEQEQPWNTSLIAEHAGQLLIAKKFAEAQGKYEIALRRSPEMWIFRGLTTCYREQGQTEAWVKAAGAMLEQPDQSLDHATVANDLAKYLIKQGQVDRAWPWAERAAESWANWAMQTAAQCAEMRQDWENAEVWTARVTQRYGEWLRWLTWCLRTEHGRSEMAAKLVWSQWDAGRRADSEVEQLWLCDLGLLLDRTDVTRESAESLLASKPQSLDAAMRLALVFDKLSDTKKRDEMLDRIANEPRPSGPLTAKIIGKLVAWHHQGNSAPLDLAPINEILATVPPVSQPGTASAIGLMLTMYGRPDEALPYLKKADSPLNTASYRLVIRQLLKARNQPLTNQLWTAPKPPKSGEKPPAEEL